MLQPKASPDVRRRPSLPGRTGSASPLRGLHGDAVLGHALCLLVPVSFLALVPIQLARDGRNRAADPGGNVGCTERFMQPPHISRLIFAYAYTIIYA